MVETLRYLLVSILRIKDNFLLLNGTMIQRGTAKPLNTLMIFPMIENVNSSTYLE